MDAEELPILGEPGPVELANSLYVSEEETFDFLATPVESRFWFGHAFPESGYQLPRRHGGVANETLRGLRDAVARALRARLERVAPSVSDIGVLNENAAAAPIIARLEWVDGDLPKVETTFEGKAFDRLRARLAVDTIELLSGAEGDRIRSCEGPGCSLLFVQHHKRRRFCHESCSHRERQMRYYRRQRGLQREADRRDLENQGEKT